MFHLPSQSHIPVLLPLRSYLLPAVKVPRGVPGSEPGSHGGHIPLLPLRILSSFRIQLEVPEESYLLSPIDQKWHLLLPADMVLTPLEITCSVSTTCISGIFFRIESNNLIRLPFFSIIAFPVSDLYLTSAFTSRYQIPIHTKRFTLFL